MHPQLTHIIAQQRTTDLRTAAERSRRTVTEPLVLADGRRLKIRPIEREDRDRLRRLFMRLTPESRYRRYLSPKPELTERELAYLVDIDHVHHEALAAVDETDGSFVAVARYVQLPDQPDVADVAIEVADDLHRNGIGTALAIQTLERARANGFTRLTAITLMDNAPARALLRLLHFRARSSGGHEIEFALQLTPELATPGSTSCCVSGVSPPLNLRNHARNDRYILHQPFGPSARRGVPTGPKSKRASSNPHNQPSAPNIGVSTSRP